MHVYAADGSINVTVVTGNTRVGRYAANQSWNVRVADGTNTGLNHKSGAINVTEGTGSSPTHRYAPDGSMYVVDTPYTPTGGQRVTVVSGSL